MKTPPSGHAWGLNTDDPSAQLAWAQALTATPFRVGDDALAVQPGWCEEGSFS